MPKKTQEIDGSPHQLCCPKCSGKEFNYYIQNIPAAPFIPKYGFASFIPYQWEVCAKCGWNTGIPPSGEGTKGFHELVEWSRAKALEGLRRCSYGYKATEDEILDSFKFVDEVE